MRRVPLSIKEKCMRRGNKNSQVWRETKGNEGLLKLRWYHPLCCSSSVVTRGAQRLSLNTWYSRSLISSHNPCIFEPSWPICKTHVQMMQQHKWIVGRSLYAAPEKECRFKYHWRARPDAGLLLLGYPEACTGPWWHGSPNPCNSGEMMTKISVTNVSLLQ